MRLISHILHTVNRSDSNIIIFYFPLQNFCKLIRALAFYGLRIRGGPLFHFAEVLRVISIRLMARAIPDGGVPTEKYAKRQRQNQPAKRYSTQIDELNGV